jgi:hypothetical protein
MAKIKNIEGLTVEDAKQKFIDFMYVGLDHGVNSIAENGGQLIPFVLTQIGEKKELKRFITERIEQGQIEGES